MGSDFISEIRKILEDWTMPWIQGTTQRTKRYEIKTSGTTGGSRSIYIDIPDLYLKSKIQKNEIDITAVGCFYDRNSFAACSVAVYSIKNKLDFMFLDNLDMSCDQICLTPTQLISVLQKVDCDEVYKNIKQVTLGGEYSRQSILDLAKKYFPNARITHIYASSETGEICSVSDGVEGYPFHKFNDFEIYPNGIQIGDNFLSDIWEIHDDRYVFIGRSDNKVNIAGNIVNLEELESRLPDGLFLDCVFCSIESPIVGNLLFFEYVSDSICDDILKEYFLNNFEKFERPYKIQKVDTIRINKNGKRKRKYESNDIR